MTTLTAKQALTYFASQIGTGENPANVNKYTRWYYGDGTSAAWCWIFLCYGFDHLNALDLIHGKHAYVPDFRTVFSSHMEYHTSNPQAGDLVAFDFNRSGEPEHIGIVERVLSSTEIQTIEGNTSDHVYRRVRNRSYVYAYASPKYAASDPNAWPGRYLVFHTRTSMMHGSDVRWVQKRLTAKGYKTANDGVYGPESSKNVKAYQKSHKLTQDGVVGPATWKSLA